MTFRTRLLTKQKQTPNLVLSLHWLKVQRKAVIISGIIPSSKTIGRYLLCPGAHDVTVGFTRLLADVTVLTLGTAVYVVTAAFGL